MRKLILMVIFCLVFIGFVLPAYAEPTLVCDPMAADSYDVEITDAGGQLVANPKGISPDATGQYGFTLKLIPLNLPDGNYTAKALANTMWGPTGWSNDYPFVKNVGDTPANVRIEDIP